ncbi:hypothetical protein FOI68_17475 [Brevibacillus sp. LEMMJ03]|uniref:hypothetical protein n=1 Tax=Brevibacillus sp. LEMMJ03 TaxID=2595056 RepID=UPI001180E727|nr:hypothetical protein [Brevibacillus sp. LEMMJ03]TRY24432.1 hypothetical protein FOI68_17475 [Brevibacillus sp. LEMMJ03]
MEKHVSGIRSVLAQQGSTGCTLRTDLRGIAKAASLRSPFKGGAPFSRKSLLRSVGLTSRSAWKHASPSMQSFCLQSEAEIRLFLFVFSEIISVGDPTTWPADCLSSVVYGINVSLKGAAEILKLVDGPGDVELPEVIIHIQQ